MRCIYGTIQLGIPIHSQAVREGLDCYIDADWARDESDRRYRTGKIIFYHGATMYCTSLSQKYKATSTSEAEFAAL